MFIVGLLIYILGYGALVGIIWLVCGKWCGIAVLCGILVMLWCEAKGGVKTKAPPNVTFTNTDTTPNNEDLGYCNRADNNVGGFNKWR